MRRRHAAANGTLEIDPGQPEFLVRFHVLPGGQDLRLLSEQQLVHANQHAVVELQCFLHHGLVQRQQRVAVVVDRLKGGLHAQTCIPRLAPGIHRQGLEPALAAAQLRLDSRNACLALIEDGQRKHHIRPHQLFPARLALEGHADPQRRQQARVSGQAVGAVHRVDLAGRGGQVQPPLDGHLLDSIERRQRGWQLRQAGGHLPLRLLTPQAQQPVEPLAVAGEPGLRLCRVERRLRVERLLQRLVLAAQGAGPILPGRQLCGRLGPQRDLLEQLDGLRIGQHRVVAGLDVHRQLEHRLRHLEANLLGLGRADLLARRQRDDAHERLDDGGFEQIALVAEQVLQTELRVVEQAGLHQIGLRDPEPLVGRLQPAVVEQRDANGLLGREVVLEQLAYLRLGGAILVTVLLPADPLADARGQLLVDFGQTGRALHRCATRQREHAQQRREQQAMLSDGSHARPPGRLALELDPPCSCCLCME